MSRKRNWKCLFTCIPSTDNEAHSMAEKVCWNISIMLLMITAWSSICSIYNRPSHFVLVPLYKHNIIMDTAKWANVIHSYSALEYCANIMKFVPSIVFFATKLILITSSYKRNSAKANVPNVMKSWFSSGRCE